MRRGQAMEVSKERHTGWALFSRAPKTDAQSPFTVITNPEDPKFDLEAYLQKIA